MSYAYINSGNGTFGTTVTYSMASAANFLIIGIEWNSTAGFVSAATTNNGSQLKPCLGAYGASSAGTAWSAASGILFYYYYTPGQDASAPTSFSFTGSAGIPGGSAYSIAEYSGLSTSSTLIPTAVSPNIQAAPGTGTNTITSSSQSVGTVPALLVSLVTNTIGGSAYTAGTSPIAFTKRLDPAGNTIAIEDARLTSSGSVSATWGTANSSVGSNSNITAMFAFAESGGGGDTFLGQAFM